MTIEIDSDSGFCFGVTRAISKAEEELARGQLYCLGDIVHNGMECERLQCLGLRTINHDEYSQLNNARVLLRAHGEPPSTYEYARRAGIELIDATCPVVLHLQERIKKEYDNANAPIPVEEENSPTPSPSRLPLNPPNPQNPKTLKPQNPNTPKPQNPKTLKPQNPKTPKPQIVIFGKKGHAEVVGLVGQTDGTAIVIESPDEVTRLDMNRDICLYSQTTKSLEGFHSIVDYIKQNISPTATFRYYDTICRQVANRMDGIRQFAATHDVIIFVSGTQSSNGKVLYGQCCDVNPRSYQVASAGEIQLDWFRDCATIGICGATSTPAWLMQKCKQHIEMLLA